MDNKNIITWVIILAVVAIAGVGIYLYNAAINPNAPGYNNQNPSSNNNNQVKGTFTVGIKDAAMSMGNVSSVWITVERAELHSQTNGWVVISDQPKQYDLLALKSSGMVALLTEANVEAGNYDQLRLTVDKVMVVENGVQKEAKLPSGELKLMGNFTVSENQQTTAVVDFIADKSLHVTGNGKIIFAPVIQLESRTNTTAEVNAKNEVAISGGQVQTNAQTGMDIDGKMKENFMIDKTIKIDVVGNIIKVTLPNESETSVKITSDTAMTTAINGNYVDVVISVKLMTENGKKVWVVNGLKSLDPKSIIIDAQTGAFVRAE